jgi:flagellum-specific ATP synthase
MMDITTPRHRSAARAIIESLSTYQRAEDVITLGAYKAGSNARVDRAMKSIDGINTYLQQEPSEASPLSASVDALVKLAGTQS